MKILLKVLSILILFCFIIIVLIYIYLFIDSRHMANISEFENNGIKYISDLNILVASDWSWNTKEKAVISVGKILHESSIPFLVEQLNYRGHWWQFWWERWRWFRIG